MLVHTFPHEFTPSLSVCSLQLQLGSGDLPITVTDALHAPSCLVYPLTDTVLGIPREYRVERACS